MMNDQVAKLNGRDPVTVSSPGGMARQFRIQHQKTVDDPWQMFAVFVRRDQAQRCLEDLLEDGRAARLVSYLVFPAAA